ncbi:hypothetical protein KSP39_PZI021135 [Platanthera zijinensis]|uniref:Uncharacterized protein n=1 Tax=Platanthera zijinensis TaxID=2320716 RepID=A0AAP0AYA4_9ASPA
MVDSGISHNLISEHLVQQLRLPWAPSPDVAVRMGDGHDQPTQVRCIAVLLSIGHYSVTADFYTFGLGGLDAIVGVAWLRTLDEVCINWETMPMQFLHEVQLCRLDGYSALLRSPISLLTIQRSLDVSFSAGLWVLFGLSVAPSPSPTGHQVRSTALADVTQPPAGSPPAQFSLFRKKDGSWRRTTQPSYFVAATTFRGTLARRGSRLLGLTIWRPKSRGCPRITTADIAPITALRTRHVFQTAVLLRLHMPTGHARAEETPWWVRTRRKTTTSPSAGGETEDAAPA